MSDKFKYEQYQHNVLFQILPAGLLLIGRHLARYLNLLFATYDVLRIECALFVSNHLAGV